MKRVMNEVAANIESRTTYEEVNRFLESKISKGDFQYHLNQKVSFDDLREYVENNMPVYQNEEQDEELKKLQRKLEDV